MNPETCKCGHPNCIGNICDHCYCQRTQDVASLSQALKCCKCRATINGSYGIGNPFPPFTIPTGKPR